MVKMSFKQFVKIIGHKNKIKDNPLPMEKGSGQPIINPYKRSIMCDKFVRILFFFQTI